MWPLFVAFGAVAGLAGHLYNGTLLRTLAVMDRLDRWPIEVRAAAIGELVGALGFFVPTLIGGGDGIPQRTLAGGAVLAVLPLAFVLRFGLGAVSYAAPVPGGLFAPILVLGAQLGLFFGAFCRLAIPAAGLDPTAFAVVGMAAFFTAVVQAPVTGIVLVIEMTAGSRCSSQRSRPVLRQCWCRTCCAASRSTIPYGSGFAGCSRARQPPPLLERQMHEQKIAVDHQQGAGNGKYSARMDEQARCEPGRAGRWGFRDPAIAQNTC